MRLTQLFTKTTKQQPAEEMSNNAKLLIQAGFVSKEMAGVYALLPLGLKVIENIKKIVRNEMNIIGGQELLMSTLQRKELWESTDRWDDKKVDIWFKSQLKNGTEVGLGWSHEEPIADMMKNYISSYRDLPTSVYQFQTKLRNETRAKSGIMRCREFIMKDLYSFSESDQKHKEIYDLVTESYLKIFKQVGIGDKTFLTFASGGSFTQFSHEFQTLTDAGEDTIYLDRHKKIAVNEEVMNESVLSQLNLKKEGLEKLKAAEVGNIFSFGGAKSEQLDLYFTDEDGVKKAVVLGSYGIGITRLMGVIAECLSDDKGLVWPERIAPFKVHLVRIEGSTQVNSQSDKIYEELTKQGVEVLYDDRDLRAGSKFLDADLMGIPYRLVISDKTIESGKHELKKRISSDSQFLNKDEIIKALI